MPAHTWFMWFALKTNDYLYDRSIKSETKTLSCTVEWLLLLLVDLTSSPVLYRKFLQLQTISIVNKRGTRKIGSLYMSNKILWWQHTRFVDINLAAYVSFSVRSGSFLVESDFVTAEYCCWWWRYCGCCCCDSQLVNITSALYSQVGWRTTQIG